MTGELAVLWWTLAAVAAIAVLIIVWVARKGRPFASGDVFRASRLSSGNRLFPTQVAITRTSVVQFTPQWIGKLEETIHMAHVSSVKIDTGVMFSDVLIETAADRTRSGATGTGSTMLSDQGPDRAVPDRLLPPLSGRRRPSDNLSATHG
jgi:hypothetical protein